MSVLNLGVLNSIKKGVDTLIKGGGKNTNSQTLTLAPGVLTNTNVFDISDVNAIIAIKLSAVTTGGIECGIRYHDEDGGIIFIGEFINFSAQSIYEQAEVRLKSTRVSFRLTNQGSANKTLTISLNKSALTNPADLPLSSDSSTMLTRGKPVQQLFTDNVISLEPEDTTNYSNILEVDADYGVIGMYGVSGSFPAVVEIGVRYHGRDNTIIHIGDSILVNVGSMYTGKVAAVVPMIHKRVSFRIVNKSPETISISQAVISPRYTDPNGNNLNFPLSPDGAMLVQLMDGVDSGAFDSFYGSLKSLRTYKNDFKLIVAPPTEKKDTVAVTEEFNLQDGVEQLRLYLKITVTGNPFPNTEDGANLVVKLKDDDFEVFSVTGDKISASGYNLIVFGDKELSNLAIERLKTIPTIFGDSVNVALQVTGTFDETNYITYEIISYQKFK